MSTLEECCAARLLIKVRGNLRPHQRPDRILLATPRAIDWMNTVLKDLQTDGFVHGAIRPIQQAGVLFNTFVSGADFEPPLPHEMNPKGNGIWEIRTHDLRFFGWFPMRGMFVISDVNTKAKCLDHSLYAGYATQAANDRITINLMDGRFIDGGLQDVI